MRKYQITSVLVVVWLFMALTTLDIFQENAINPTKTFPFFDFGFVCVFCVVTGFTFYNYKNKL